MICACCGLALPAGARHPHASDCVEALKDALRACKRCGGPVGCLKCSVKKLARTKINERAPGIADGLRLLGEIMREDT